MDNPSGSGKLLGAEALYRPLFLWSLPFTFLFFGLPIVSKDFGASALQIGGLFSIFTATTLVLRPVVGWALDKFGRKLFFVAALLIYAAAMILFALADSISWLFAARLIQGIGSAFLWTAANTIVADLTTTGERGLIMGKLTEITTRGGLVGIFAAFAAVSLLPDGVGWKVAFIGFSIMTFLGAWFAWKDLPEQKPNLAPQADTQKTKVSRMFLKLLIIVFITGVPEAMLSPIYLTYLQDKFSTEMSTLAWAFFPSGLVAAFLSARLGGLSDRFGRVPAMAVGLAGAGIVSMLMPRLPSLIWLAVLYTLSAVMWGISEPAETAMVSELTGHEQVGFAYGLYNFVESLGFTIGPLIGGLLYDSIGKEVPFYLNGVILLISAVLVIVILRESTSRKTAGLPLE